MYKKKKILVIIAARGGSKGVPGKNIKLLAGRPLIDYSIKAALGAKYPDRVIVSTDDNKIASVAEKCGAEIPFMRPAELATDSALIEDALIHAVKFVDSQMKADLVILIQPTNPLVLSEDIDQCIKGMIDNGLNSCISLRSISERPEWMFFIDKNKAKPFINRKGREESIPRQKLKKLYITAGSIYGAQRGVFMRRKVLTDPKSCYGHIVPDIRGIDIDTLDQFEKIETIIRKNPNLIPKFKK